MGVPVEQDAKDAARYRWLRQHAKEIVFPRGDNPTNYDPSYEGPEELDAAIDKELAKIEIPKVVHDD